MKNLLVSSDSAEKTRLLGKQLAGEFRGSPLNIFLDGELGAGKTTFLQGIGAGLNIISNIVSPSFQLIRKYAGSGQGSLIHVDLCRLNSAAEILSLGWWELLDEQAVTAVEWAQHARDILPEDGIFINIKYISAEEREIEIARKKAYISWY